MNFGVKTQALMPGESIFLQEPVFSYVKHRAFPKSMATTVTKSRTLHQQPTGTRTSSWVPSKRRCALPALFHILYFRLFPILLEMLNLWEKKVMEMPKRKRNPPYLNGRDFFSQLEEREVWQGPQT